ncbi:MAG: type II toxin-antitoxin system VapC family toxin [Bacteroidales bacterium]|nr:type II toxin-antitoxin system VapC family toxin [Bacteroidales bacterium]
MKKALIDTDIISYFLKDNTTVVRHVENYLNEFEVLNISIVTYYEILNGLMFKDAKKQLESFKNFAKNCNIINLSPKSVHISAEIYSNLRRTGQVISHTDVLIAGIAIVNDLTLITNNISHFSRISELNVDNWNK